MEEERPLAYGIAIWRARPSYEASLVSAWEALARWTIRRQQGVLAMRLLRDEEDPRRLLAVSVWADRQDIDRWQETPEYRALMMEVSLLCEQQEERHMGLIGQVLLSAEANG